MFDECLIANLSKLSMHCILVLPSFHLLFVSFLQALYTNSSTDERGEPAEEEEDHTYELLLTAQTKIPPPNQESQSRKGKCAEANYKISLYHFTLNSWQEYSRMSKELVSFYFLKSTGAVWAVRIHSHLNQQDSLHTHGQPLPWLRLSYMSRPSFSCGRGMALHVIGLNGIKLGGHSDPWLLM